MTRRLAPLDDECSRRQSIAFVILSFVIRHFFLPSGGGLWFNGRRSSERMSPFAGFVRQRGVFFFGYASHQSPFLPAWGYKWQQTQNLPPVRVCGASRRMTRRLAPPDDECSRWQSIAFVILSFCHSSFLISSKSQMCVIQHFRYFPSPCGCGILYVFL